jgi:CBS domain-containing protein
VANKAVDGGVHSKYRGRYDMLAKQIMGKVKAPKQNARGRDIARTMISQDFCHLPVVDDSGAVVGIISEFDLLKAIKDGKDLEKVTAQELMSKKVFTVNESDPIDTVIDIMTTQYIISLPVVKNGKLVGVISRRNILHSMVDHEYQEYFMTIQ